MHRCDWESQPRSGSLSFQKIHTQSVSYIVNQFWIINSINVKKDIYSDESVCLFSPFAKTIRCIVYPTPTCDDTCAERFFFVASAHWEDMYLTGAEKKTE